MNEKDYHVLTEHEKHLIRTILNMLEKSHLLSNADEQFIVNFKYYSVNTMQAITVKYYEIN